MFKYQSTLSVAGVFTAALTLLSSASPVPAPVGSTTSPITCITTTADKLDIFGTPAKLTGTPIAFDLSKAQSNLGNFGKIYEMDGDNGVKFHATTDSDAATIVLRNEANKDNVDYVYMVDETKPDKAGLMKTETIYYYLFKNDECVADFTGNPSAISVSVITPKQVGGSSSQ